MKKTLHFKNKKNYEKWLAYNWIHNVEKMGVKPHSQIIISGRKHKVKHKKGQGLAGAFLIGMITLFVVALIYGILSSPFTSVYNSIYNLTNDSGVHDTMGKVRTTWIYFPLILIVGVIIYMLAQGMKREPYYYG